MKCLGIFRLFFLEYFCLFYHHKQVNGENMNDGLFMVPYIKQYFYTCYKESFPAL